MSSRRKFLALTGMAGAATVVSKYSLAALPEIVHQDSVCLLYTSPSPRDS